MARPAILLALFAFSTIAAVGILSGASAAHADTGGSGTPDLSGVTIPPLNTSSASIPSEFPTLNSTALTSTNWSGYALAGAAGSFTGATGSWVVPTVSCPGTTALVALWVGLDGLSSSDPTVEQAGVIGECVGGTAIYADWWEMYPTNSVQVVNEVNPGDVVSVGATYDSSSGDYNMFVTDLSSSSSSFSVSEKCGTTACERSSAEWITEAPCCESGTTVYPLPDFGTAGTGNDYTGVAGTDYVTYDGTTSTISSASAPVFDEITMVNSAKAVLAAPSSLSTDASSFAVFYHGTLPSITLSPNTGNAGAEVTIAGDDFSPDAPIVIGFDGSTVGSATPATTGAFSHTFAVPSGATSGTHTVTASDGGGTETGSATFTVGGTFTFAATVSCNPAAIDLGMSTSCTVTVVGDSTHMGHNLGITFHTTDSGSFSPSASCNTAGTGTTTTCSVTYTPGASGTWTISAHSGNANWPTTDPTFSLAVSERTTSTAVACVPTSVAVNAATVCTATVTDTDSGTASTPTGTVSFSTGGGITSRFTPDTCTLSQVSAGIASCEVIYSPAPGTEATHNIEAVYAGDSTHAGSTAPLFPITATTRDTSTSVTCSPSSVPVNSPTTCTATVTDTDTGITITPTGTVSFSTDGGLTTRFTPSSCTLGQVSSGVASCSVSYSPSTVTTHKVAASYGGDTDHDTSTATPFVVTGTSAAPAITTAPQPSSVALGGTSVTLDDTATLTGGSLPTGTITFTLQGPGGVVDTETVTVNGDGSYVTPTGYTLPSIGTVTGSYQWNAVYSGDSNNNAASDTGAVDEQVTVSSASPTIVTTPSIGSVTLSGSTVTLEDSAALSGGYSPGGTITFALQGPGGLVDTETLTVTGNGVYNTPTGYTLPTTGTVTGSYEWDATYSGDTNNLGASDIGSPNEQVTVNPASLSIVTTPSPATVSLGITPRTLTDSAVLSGGYHEGGTLTFLLQAPGGGTVDTETVTVTGDGTYNTPTGFTIVNGPGVTGTYQWTVQYSGDGNNAAVTGSNLEDVTVTLGIPNLTTAASQSSVTLAGSSPLLTDTATISGGASPTGTLTFTLTGPGSALVDTETVTVNGDGTYSTPVGYLLPNTGQPVVGTYQWDATYSGDSNNIAVSDNNAANEQTLVSPASPALLTTSSPASATLGTTPRTLTDSAALSGGYHESGTLSFTLIAPGGVLVDTETVTVSGDGTYSTPVGYTLPSSGTVTGAYQWQAAYSGDGNNNAVSENNGIGEQTLVSSASPTLATTPSPSSANLGAGAPTLKDTAAVSGGYFETGTITFTLTGPGGSLVDTETVTVNGNGAYSTPIGFKLPSTGIVAGTYQWSATYSGDSNNIGVSENGAAAEQVSVTPAQTSISTTLSASTILASYSVFDSASLAGGFSPTGTVTFYYSTTNSCPTATATQVGAPVALAAPKSTASTFPTYGTYYWYAVYSGDPNNLGSTSTCELLNVQDFGVVATPATVNIVAGTSGSSTISLSNLGGFSGTVSLAIPSPVTGLTSTLSAASISGAATSTLTVSTPFAGTYSLTIRGTTTNGLGETVQHQAIVTVVVSYKTCPQVTNNGGQNLKGADLEFCNLAGLNLSGDNLQGANLNYSNLQNTNLKGANMQGADLANSNAAGADFQGANMQSAVLTNTIITGDNFQGVNLQKADLAGDSASGANFQGANMQTANLSGGDFDHVNFQGANMQNSNLSNGNFDYANFAGANTQGANTTGATFSGATSPP